MCTWLKISDKKEKGAYKLPSHNSIYSHHHGTFYAGIMVMSATRKPRETQWRIEGLRLLIPWEIKLGRYAIPELHSLERNYLQVELDEPSSLSNAWALEEILVSVMVSVVRSGILE